MKIIMLIGRQNSGKTTTCRLLKNCIESVGEHISQAGITQRNIGEFDTGDFTFLCFVAGKKILISSQGDQASRIISKIEQYTTILKDCTFVFTCREEFADVIDFARSRASVFVAVHKEERTDEDDNRAKKDIFNAIF
jgi:molybdopterin-guanine dinucleotide biosynthesis protein